MRDTKYDDDLRAAVTRTHPKYVHLFNRAIKRETSLLGDIIAANAFTEQNGGTATYHCVTDNTKVHGRNHLEALRVSNGEALVTDYQYFSNALIVDSKGHGKQWSSITTRAALGRYLVFTYEWDRDDPEFLSEQFNWNLPLRKRDQKDKVAKTHIDCIGIC